MKTFTDNAGRTWTVQINVDAIKRVRDLVQVNLLEVIEGDLLERLASDPVLLCDCVYALCKPQADAQSIGDAEFGRAMGGDVIDTASDALLEELIDFFPKGRRTLLRTALSKLNRLNEMTIQSAMDRIESPELEERIKAELARLNGSSGSAPESSASVPAPSP